MRDPEASDAFTLDQLEAVFRVADAQLTRLQTGSGYVRDASWAGKTARVLAFTGMHIRVLSGGARRSGDEQWYEPPIGGEAVRGDFLFWRRPKNEKPIPMPIKREIAPWLAAYLDQPRPGTPQRYEQILGDWGEEAGLQVNPLRFRHTCGVILYHVLKLDAATVQRLMGFTPSTMLTYVVRTKEQIREDMVKLGW